jgi:uncharacterized membrane protein
MASTMAVQRRSQGAAPVGNVAAQNASAARERRYQLAQVALFVAGAVLMPLGIVAIFVAWYGVAHSHYEYDQLTYIVSGGVLGVALVLLGGFLYFGAWLAKMANDQKESTRQLADSLLVLADAVGRGPAQPTGAGAAVAADAGAVPVLAGGGSTVHRRDCALIAHRDDLRPLTGAETDLGTCRVCRPNRG